MRGLPRRCHPRPGYRPESHAVLRRVLSRVGGRRDVATEVVAAAKQFATLEGVSSVRELKDQGCSVLIDARFDPVLVASFYGMITPKLILEFSAWFRGYLTSLRPGTKYVMINDPRGVPSHSPMIRKIAGEEMKKLRTHMELHGLENIMIIDNALLRGAFTALSWLTGDRSHCAVKDMPEAITTALQALTRAGLPWPAGLDARWYESPRTVLKKIG
jgi:hypothetical protein